MSREIDVEKDFEECLKASMERLNGNRYNSYRDDLNAEYERYNVLDDRYMNMCKDRLWD